MVLLPLCLHNFKSCIWEQVQRKCFVMIMEHSFNKTRKGNVVHEIANNIPCSFLNLQPCYSFTTPFMGWCDWKIRFAWQCSVEDPPILNFKNFCPFVQALILSHRQTWPPHIMFFFTLKWMVQLFFPLPLLLRCETLKCQNSDM